MNFYRITYTNVVSYLLELKVRIEKYKCFLKVCNNIFVTVTCTVVRENGCLPNYLARALHSFP